MPAPVNKFKARLRTGETQIGLWLGLGEATTAELCAGAGFDWLVIDGEHGPNGLRDMLDQLRAVGERSSAVVRVRDDNRSVLKQMLDIGAQTLLIPMIESAAQASEAVRSVRYPPGGVRGVGAALARASDFSAIPDYLETADEQICLLLQVETLAGAADIDAILAVEGVDGIFVGPADLAADMGHLGQPGAPKVRRLVRDLLERIRQSGKAAGILTFDHDLAREYAAMGVEFLAVGSDVTTFRDGLKTLRAMF
ncbi:aldolase/citrate lyase family protein [Tropicimonas sp.]|uniref:aldolase/citrate lyase family protein n=1 Tax=Tropicimonas sp. TaxID=2067044 RepID=UPI003A84FC8F